MKWYQDIVQWFNIIRSLNERVELMRDDLRETITAVDKLKYRLEELEIRVQLLEEYIKNR